MGIVRSRKYAPFYTLFKARLKNLQFFFDLRNFAFVFFKSRCSGRLLAILRSTSVFSKSEKIRNRWRSWKLPFHTDDLPIFPLDILISVSSYFVQRTIESFFLLELSPCPCSLSLEVYAQLRLCIEI